jgi:uncharacterized protein YegP (UPF0339 family)
MITTLSLITITLLFLIYRKGQKPTTMSHQQHAGYRIEIRDARKRRFRVRCLAPNNEVLQTSEVLNTEQAVVTNIRAMSRVFDSSSAPEVRDRTRLSHFRDTKFHFSEEQ